MSVTELSSSPLSCETNLMAGHSFLGSFRKGGTRKGGTKSKSPVKGWTKLKGGTNLFLSVLFLVEPAAGKFFAQFTNNTQFSLRKTIEFSTISRIFPNERRDREGRDKIKISDEGRDVPPVPPLKGGTRKLCSTPTNGTSCSSRHASTVLENILCIYRAK